MKNKINALYIVLSIIINNTHSMEQNKNKNILIMNSRNNSDDSSSEKSYDSDEGIVFINDSGSEKPPIEKNFPSFGSINGFSSQSKKNDEHYKPEDGFFIPEKKKAFLQQNLKREVQIKRPLSSDATRRQSKRVVIYIQEKNEQLEGNGKSGEYAFLIKKFLGRSQSSKRPQKKDKELGNISISTLRKIAAKKQYKDKMSILQKEQQQKLKTLQEQLEKSESSILDNKLLQMEIKNLQNEILQFKNNEQIKILYNTINNLKLHNQKISDELKEKNKLLKEYQDKIQELLKKVNKRDSKKKK